jgi:hypothetical protein
MQTINEIPIIDSSQSKTGCCTLINPADWDDKTIVFDNKLFAKAKVRSFLHFPLNMSRVMREAQADIEADEAETDGFLILSDEVSPWHSDQYFAVDKEVPELENVRMSGEYITKVFEGPYKDARIWHRQLRDFVKAKGKQPLKTYFFYTTCPKCAVAYGKNYVVGFEQVA